MKKNLLLITCMCLLMAVSTGLAADAHDTIIAYGTSTDLDTQSGNGNLKTETILAIFQTYVSEHFNADTVKDNGNPTARWDFTGDAGTVCIDIEEPWSYAILAANSGNIADWYLFKNDYVFNGPAATHTYTWMDVDGITVYHGDNLLITPKYGAEIEYPYYFAPEIPGINGPTQYGSFTAIGNANNPFNQLDYTFWTLHEIRIPDPVPEPGSILLLGSGVIGLALAAKRRLGRK